MKILKKILLVLLVVLVVMQFFGTEKNMAGEVPATDIILTEQPSDDVAQILKSACYDCHSNTTAYPWYAKVAPVSFWIGDHIEDGKKHLNFSEWANYTEKRKAHKMEEFVEEVREHKMPMESYVWMHKEAKLNEGQIVAITNWAQQVRTKYEKVAP